MAVDVTRHETLGRDGMGRGFKEEEGVKPREETGERHHTHTAQDGRRGSSTPSCQAFRRGRGTRRLSGSCARAARRPAGAKRPRLRRDRPRAGVGSRGRGAWSGRAHNAESAAAAAAAEGPRGFGGSARRGREARRGNGVRAPSRCRQLRPDPVSVSPAPFIVLCPWEGKQNVLEHASRRGWRAGPLRPAPRKPCRRRRLAPRAGSASAPRGPGPGVAGGPAADPAVGGGGPAAGTGPAGKGRRRVTAGGSPKGTALGEPLSVRVSYFDI